MSVELYQDAIVIRDFPEYDLKFGDMVKPIDFIDHPNGGEEGCLLEQFSATGESLQAIAIPRSAIGPVQENQVICVRDRWLVGQGESHPISYPISSGDRGSGQNPLVDRLTNLQTLLTGLGLSQGIVKSPEVCGGGARIAGTRIPVWLLVHGRNLGYSDRDLLQRYPMLSAGDLALAWAYALAFSGEIERAIHENAAA